MDLGSWLGLASGRFVTGLFIFTRFGALLVAAPLLGGKSVPAPIRIGLGGVLTLILTPLVQPIELDGLPLLVAGLVKEAAVGLILGWAASLFFATAQMAGEWLDLQSGFQAGQLMNPVFDAQVAPLGNFSNLVAGLIFLGTSAYGIVIRAAVKSLALSPPGALRLGIGSERGWTTMLVQAIWIAIQMAAPVGASLFLAEVATGLINRAMPQVNIMMLTLPVKASLAIAALALSVPYLAHTMAVTFDRMGEALAGIVRAMGGS
jgi:flagellar biosynthetic protein FliR